MSGSKLEELDSNTDGLENPCSRIIKQCNEKWKFTRKRERRICYLSCCTLIALFVSIIAPMVLYAILDLGINDGVVISGTSSPSYESWLTNTEGDGAVPIGYNIYVFDVQNPSGIVLGEKPVVVELGPYAFHEYYYKIDVTWTDDGDTVTFRNQRYYVPDPANTGPGLSYDDKITLPYPTVLAFSYLLGCTLCPH